MRGDISAERTQGMEDFAVVLIVRTQLHTVMAAGDQRNFQRIDRVQTQPFAEQRRLRVDLLRCHFKLQRFDEMCGDLMFEGRLQCR